jgi:TonB family protein
MNPTPQVRRESGTDLPGHEVLRIPLPAVPRIDPSSIDASDAADFRFDPPGSGLGTGAVSAVQGSGGVYTGQLVDRTVVPRSDNGHPAYPSPLRLSGIDGDVLVRFVVDSVGRVEPASITIIQTTHALFGDAVRQWLRRTRYTPAELLGRPVRQLVEQRIAFTLRP